MPAAETTGVTSTGQATATRKILTGMIVSFETVRMKEKTQLLDFSNQCKCYWRYDIKHANKTRLADGSNIV